MANHDDLTQDIKTKAHELGNDAKKAVQAEADQIAGNLRDAALEKTARVRNAAKAAASEFDVNSLQARAAQQVADHVEGLANKLRSSDLNTVTRDVSNFARKNPALFIGGAALLGFAATRFLKARDPELAGQPVDHSDQWNSRPSPTERTGGVDVQS